MFSKPARLERPTSIAGAAQAHQYRHRLQTTGHFCACDFGCGGADWFAAYVGTRIGVARTDLPETDSGEYYWADLEGLQVVDQDGRVLGKVAYLLATGANGVLVIQGDQEIQLPFLNDDVIKDVDLASGIISVDWEWD